MVDLALCRPTAARSRVTTENEMGWKSYLPRAVASRVAVPPSLERVVANVGWLFADRAARMVASLFVGVWVARYLGPEQYGVFNYAVAFVAFLTPLASLGLDDLLVRDLVAGPERKGVTLGSAFLLKVAGTAVALIVGTATARWVIPGAEQVWTLVAVLGVGVLFAPLDVIASWFTAQVTARYTVLARNTAFAIGVAVRVALLLGGASLIALAAASALESMLAALGLLFWYRRTGGALRDWKAERGRAVALLSEGWPLMLSGVAIMVYQRVGQVMLGAIAGPTALGIYATALRVSEIWYFIPIAIGSSVAPSIIEARAAGDEAYYRRLQRVFSAVTYISVPLALVLTLASRSIIVGLFGEAYSAAAPVLAIHCWTGCFVFLGVVRQIWIVAEGHAHAALAFTSIGAATNVALNAVLVPRYAEMGAAISALVSYATSDYAVYLAFPRFRRIGIMMTRALLFRRGAARSTGSGTSA